jgi:hypothetical protein
MVLAYFPRTASFNPRTAFFCSLPAALSVLPSVSSFLLPTIFPADFFHGTFGLLCQHGLMRRRILSQTAHARSYNYNCAACLFWRRSMLARLNLSNAAFGVERFEPDHLGDQI